MADRLQIRRDTADNWTEANPILAQGEWGYELDFNRLKIGDGVLPWVDLPYFAGGGSGYVLKELFTYEDSATFTLQETPSDIIAVDLRGQVLDGVSGLAWEIDGDDVTVLYDLEEGDTIQIIYTVGSIGGSAVTTAQAQTIALGIVNAQKDEEGGIAANDTSVLNLDSIDELSTINRIGRTRAFVNGGGRGGNFTYFPSSSGLTSDGGVVFEAEDGGYWRRSFTGSLVEASWYGASQEEENNKTAILAAINYIESIGGGTIKFPSGVLHCTDNTGFKISSSNINFQGGDGGTEINFTDLQFVGGIRRTGFIFEGTRSVSAYTLESDLSKGSFEIPVNDSSFLGILSVNQDILLRSDEIFNDERTLLVNGYNYNKGEWCCIKEIGEDSITLYSPLTDSYSYSSGLYIDTFDFVENISFSNITINTNFPDEQVYGISFEYFKNIRITNCCVKNSGFCGIYCTTGIDAIIESSKIEDCLEPTLGYGIYFLGVLNGRSSKNDFKRVRHAVDASGQSNRGYLPSRHIYFTENDVQSAIRAGVSTHGGCEYVIISGNIISGCSEGIISRGKNTKIVDNEIYACSGDGVLAGISIGETVDGDKGLGGTNLEISNNKIHDSPAHGIAFFAPISNVLISGNEILNIGQRNSGGNNNGISIRSSTVRNLKIKDNTINCLNSNTSVGVGISINPALTADGNNQKDVNISENLITLPSSGSPIGVRVSGNSANTPGNESSRITISENNIVGGNTPIQLSSGRFYSKVKIIGNILEDYSSSESNAINFPDDGFTQDHPVIMDNWQKSTGLGYQGVALHSSDKPSFGVWRQGTIVMHRDPVAGSPSGWIYIGSDFQSISRLGDSINGVYTTSASGSATSFNFNHNLGRVPSLVQVTAISLDASGIFYISSRTSTNITITYISAPGAGTNNLSWSITIQ